MGEHGTAPIYLQGLNLLHPLTAGIPVCAGPKSRWRCSAALHYFPPSSLSTKYYNDESATLAYASFRRT